MKQKLTESQKASQELIAKTKLELAAAEKPKSHTRSWQSSRGYRFLVPWSNGVLLRILIRIFTATLPLSSSSKPLKSSKGHHEHRLKTQLDDAGRSVVSNIEEGYKRDTTHAYLKFLSYSQGSLEEIHGLVNQCRQDGFLKSVPGSSLAGFGIDLKSWNSWCRNPKNSSKLLYFPLKSSNKRRCRKLKEVKGEDLTYEMFIELINKTDYLLRKLVLSLELKDEEKKLQVANYRPR